MQLRRQNERSWNQIEMEEMRGQIQQLQEINNDQRSLLENNKGNSRMVTQLVTLHQLKAIVHMDKYLKCIISR